MSLVVRAARPADVPEMMRLLVALAVNEGEPDAVKATGASLGDALFGPTPAASALVAEEDGQVMGLALYYPTYSTWTGRAGLYLEDLVVSDAARGRGVGRLLFRALAREAQARDCARIDWAVMDGNAGARAFYEKIGGHHSLGWAPWRLEGEALTTLANEESGG